MRVVKPQKLSLLTRPFLQERHPFLSVAVLSLHQFDGAMLSEAELWRFLGSRLAEQGTPDVGMIKNRAEFLVCGDAQCPGGQPQPMLDVSARLGEVSRSLRVFGQRHWDGDDSIDGPEPFASMPLSWSRAFGGPDFAANPLGVGHGARRGERAPLPNIEDPSDLIRSRGDRPAPVSFGAVDISWPLRQRKAGTYDDEWLRSQYPGHALDMDWSFYNIAPEEQQLDSPVLRGDEHFELRGLHADFPQQTGQLPPLRARVFLDNEEQGDWRLQEVEMGLTTVWFFPNDQRLLLVWHGALPIQSDDATDVRALMIGADDFAQSRSLADYGEIFAARLDPESGATASLDDTGLLPRRPLFHSVADATASENSALHERGGYAEQRMEALEEHQRATVRQRIIDAGGDPDQHLDEAEPPPEPPEDLGELMKFAEQQQIEAEVRMEQAAQEAKKGQAKAVAELEAEGMDPAVLGDPNAPIVGPPALGPASEEARQENLEAARSMGAAGEGLIEMMDSDFVRGADDEMAEFRRDAYRQSAHTQAVLPRMSGERATEQREAASTLVGSGADLRRQDFTARDLSGFDFGGADLSGSWFESADLTGADLSGCNLEGAVLTRASLNEAKLGGVNLSGANLGGADLTGANLDGANLEGVVLEGAIFCSTSLRAAKLEGLIIRDTTFDAVDLTDARLADITVFQSEFTNLVAPRAEILRANFLHVVFKGADFSGAQIDRAGFIDVSAEGARFDATKIGTVAFLMGTKLREASFEGAEIVAAGLREAELCGANFAGVRAEAIDLSFANLSEARLERAALRDALILRANLSGANLRGADLAGAILQKADLRAADLDDANFYGADLAEIRRDAGTTDVGANFVRARLVPEWRPLPPVPDRLPWRTP